MINELGLIQSIQFWFDHPAGRVIVVFMARWLIYIFAPLLILAVYRLKGSAIKHALSELVSSTVMAWSAALIIEKLIQRIRPFRASALVTAWVPPPLNLYSFPSAHAAVAFAFATTLTFIKPRWGFPVFGLAVLVAFGRVAAGVHYPSDVLAGALLGCLAAILIKYLFRAGRRWLRQPLPRI